MPLKEQPVTTVPSDLNSNRPQLLCTLCSAPSTASCGFCKKVNYCCKAHQQKHWKSHKPQCFPLVLQNSDILGRHLVATRDIKQGEIILKESPLFSGPHRQDQGVGDVGPICLSCFRLVVQVQYKCSKCRWPLCGPICEKDSQHTNLECKIFSSRKLFPESFSKFYKYNIYEAITVLRGVLQKEQNPSQWAKIVELQSHAEDRDQIEQAKALRQFTISFVRETCGQAQCQDEDIDQVLGAIGVNAFVSDDGVSQAELYRNGTYLFHMASMPAHDCVPNSSWVIQLNSDFHLRASIPIKLSESVTFLYTEATLATKDRQRKLQNSKYFLCACKRCCDPTELGSFFSAVKCPEGSCIDGYLVPQDPLKLTSSSGSEWGCNKCKVTKSWDFVSSIILEIDKELEKVGEDDCFKFVRILDKILRRHSGVTLHPNHYKLHDIQNNILQRISFLIASLPQNQIQGQLGFDIKWAHRLVELSRQCLTIADIIWPGYNRHRGRLLYFLQQGITILLMEKVSKSKTSTNNKKSKSKPASSTLSIKAEFEEIMKAREEIFKMFAIEPEGREENFIAKSVTQDTPEIQLLRSIALTN